jgi:hypothetical protein
MDPAFLSRRLSKVMTIQTQNPMLESKFVKASRRTTLYVLALVIVSLTNCGGEVGESQTIPVGVQPLTTVNESAGTGYFVDPLPVHLQDPKGSYIPSL